MVILCTNSSLVSSNEHIDPGGPACTGWVRSGDDDADHLLNYFNCPFISKVVYTRVGGIIGCHNRSSRASTKRLFIRLNI